MCLCHQVSYCPPLSYYPWSLPPQPGFQSYYSCVEDKKHFPKYSIFKFSTYFVLFFSLSYFQTEDHINHSWHRRAARRQAQCTSSRWRWQPPCRCPQTFLLPLIFPFHWQPSSYQTICLASTPVSGRLNHKSNWSTILLHQECGIHCNNTFNRLGQNI